MILYMHSFFYLFFFTLSQDFFLLYYIKGIHRCVKLDLTLFARETTTDTDSKISQVTLTRYTILLTRLELFLLCAQPSNLTFFTNIPGCDPAAWKVPEINSRNFGVLGARQNLRKLKARRRNVS